MVRSRASQLRQENLDVGSLFPRICWMQRFLLEAAIWPTALVHDKLGSGRCASVPARNVSLQDCSWRSNGRCFPRFIHSCMRSFNVVMSFIHGSFNHTPAEAPAQCTPLFLVRKVTSSSDSGFKIASVLGFHAQYTVPRTQTCNMRARPHTRTHAPAHASVHPDCRP